jgi:SNF2-related domain/Helicase conserved C-terminal domain
MTKRKRTTSGENRPNLETGKLTRSFDWRTTDEEEIGLRQQRAREEQPRIRPLDRANPIFSQFEVHSPSGMIYSVEVRSVASRRFSCTCVDFRTNGLGTCKHAEAVLLYLEARFPKLFAKAQQNESDRIDIVLDRTNETIRIENPTLPLPKAIAKIFGAGGVLKPGYDPEEVVDRLKSFRLSALRLSHEIPLWLEQMQRRIERISLRRDYEHKVQTGIYPLHETLVPLFPYQREGMLHLAFTERALLADEMGLGKTIQAIAACALLHRLGKASRVLVITPASLKTEWEEQIQQFTRLPYQIVFGRRSDRHRALQNSSFFTLVNYEQMMRDALDVNRLLRPDIVVLDEAQRIKNWGTKTAQAIKRLTSRFAFVLTGTPIENRIDELYSIVDFLDPNVFGPLFRFNREFYELDDRGRPAEYRNLDRLHDRVSPLLLRRRKADVETQLPGRTDRNLFLPLNASQSATYAEHELQVAKLVHLARRRPLTKQEHDKLMRELAMTRMICDTNYILDSNDPTSPKVDELQKILEECLSEPDIKVVVFSEWERMLLLVRQRLREMKLGYAWHTGSVAQRRRRAEIQMFKADTRCRVFLSTDSGSVGLNLQVASVVVNCDLPWNPAKLEQRIARAWRKNQTRAVTVINLVAERTIEHRMLGTLAAKKGLADGILDHVGDLTKIKLKTGGQTFFSRLEQIITPGPLPPAIPPPPTLPVDRVAAFAERADKLLNSHLVACEERFPEYENHSVLLVVVTHDANFWLERLRPIYDELLLGRHGDSGELVQLEVIDRITAESLSRLTEAGLLRHTTRATRHLYPKPGIAPALLSDEERLRVDSHRQQAKRKLKMARVLAAEELLEEAAQALKEAILYQGRAYAIEARLSEPEKLHDAVMSPLAASWGDVLPVVRHFLSDSQDVAKMIQELGRSLL